jgi:hypothetical protein
MASLPIEIDKVEKELKILYTEQYDLQKKKLSRDVSVKKLKSLQHSFDSVSETIEDLLSELWRLENPDKEIADVLQLSHIVIEEILPRLLLTFDSIRRRQSNVSVPLDLEISISELQQFGNHPDEWSKLIAMLQLPKKCEKDSDSDEEEEPVPYSKLCEVWKYKLSWLHVIFFEDKIHSDYLSDFGLLMAFALTNCDEYKSILNTENDDDEMIREFFSDCEHLAVVDVLKKHPILFFKALDHPMIRNHLLEENPELEPLETLHDHLLKICSFFERFHSNCKFSASELNQIISDLEKVYMLDV